MIYLDSAPHYHEGVCSSEYIDEFYAWLVTKGADKKSRQCMGRLATIVKANLLSETSLDELTDLLNALADDLNSSLVRLSNIPECLEKIESRVTSPSPKARLLAKISSLEPQPLFKDLFLRLGNEEFSKVQAEGVMRDLKLLSNPKPEEIVKIFDAWL